MLNNVSLMGRITKEPELKYTPSGVPVLSFSIAVDRDYVSNGSRETDFIDIVAWRNTAEFIKSYFSKGQMIAILGRLQIRKWTDKNGNQRNACEIIAENVYFAGNKYSYESTSDKLHQVTYTEEYEKDDVPF